MKSLFIALLIAVTFAFPVQAQRQATHALLGPVRTVRTETATVFKKDGQYVEGPRILTETILFTEDGRRPELCLYDGKGALSRRIVLIWEGKKQVEFQNYDGAGKMWLRGVNLYDAEGRVRENAYYNGDGSLSSKTTFTRNDRGQVTESAQYNASGILIDKFNYTYNGIGETVFERRQYHPTGWLRVRELHNVPEKRTETITYNENGSLAGKTIRVDKDISEYAADGSLKKSTFITSTGRLPEETTYSPDGTTRKESQIPDELDTYGNWTKQTKWISDSQGTRPVKVTYRVITYYLET